MGRFCLSPFARLTDSGLYSALLSIRSGRGSASHDRVFRFAPLFASRDEAVHYAAAQGRDFVQGGACLA